METIYHWVGLVAVWAFVAAVTSALCWLAWHHRPRNTFTRRVGNAWVWLTVFVFGRRWLIPIEGARLLLTYDNSPKHKLDKWERNIIAFNIRYSKRKGWAPGS